MTSSGATPDRLMLWVDGVGSYLVCLGNEVTLGQPSAEANPDVPILGDLSRRHAVIRREGEVYMVEAIRSVEVDRRSVQGVAPLFDGSMITLGEGVQLRFRKPHPLSNTVKLEFISRHRTQPSTDGVLLMADTCVLGPGSTSHIAAPNWPHEVVLFRQAGVLGCRTAAKITVDGATRLGRCELNARSRVEGEEFAFSLEPLEKSY